jgi:hypothetical protein
LEKREREKTNALVGLPKLESLQQQRAILILCKWRALFTTPLLFRKWGGSQVVCFCSFCNGFAKKKLKLGRLPQNSIFYVRMEWLYYQTPFLIMDIHNIFYLLGKT